MSTFYVIDQYLSCTTCSTSDLSLIILSVLYKVINKLYDERNLLHTSINQKVEEAQMMATAAQLDALTAVNAKRYVSAHKINAITANNKFRIKDFHAMRKNHMNQLVSLKSEVKSK